MTNPDGPDDEIEREWIELPGPHGASIRCIVQRDPGQPGICLTDLYVHHPQGIPAETLRELSVPRLEARLQLHLQRDTNAQPRPKLTRPDGINPEIFYQQVALAYLEYAAQTRAVNKAMAEEAKVPIPTAERWIQEARRRRYLAPATRRKGNS